MKKLVNLIDQYSEILRQYYQERSAESRRLGWVAYAEVGCAIIDSRLKDSLAKII